MKTVNTLHLILFAMVAQTATMAHAAVVDGKPSFDQATDSGLYIWRSASGRWQTRLLAGGNSLGVDGTFVSGEPVSSISNVGVDVGDSVEHSSANEISFDFSVAAVDVDGVAFSLSFGADLCLSANGDVTSVFLGQDAVPASLPVALSGSPVCGSNTVSDSGLFISRSADDVWQIRLLSETSQVSFDGTFEAEQPLDGFNPISFETSDSASLLTPATLAMNMSTWPGRFDRVDITVPNGAGACLRDATGSESVVYRGTNPADSLPVTTPVDLTNNGACGDSTTTSPPPIGARKFNNGHYVAFMRGRDAQTVMANSVSAGVVGFMKRYSWRRLEPSQGQYDFSEIQSDLEFTASQGLQFVVMIEDKTFVNKLPIPDYLANFAQPNLAGGFTAVRWSLEVRSRMKALIAALGEAFDSHPNFEGIATQETAPGFTAETLDATDYTPEKYRDAIIDVLTHATVKMPTSRIFWFMNFFPRKQSYIREIALTVAPSGVIIGAPDVMPDEPALQRLTYPIYDDLAGLAPLFGQVEPICYHHLHEDTSFPTQYWTPEELLHYAQNNLNVSYMFWVRFNQALYSDSYDFYDARPVIANNPITN